MSRRWAWFHRFGSPPWFHRWAGRYGPWLTGAGVLLLLVGCVWGLAFTPPDYQMGDSFRIIYVHVPVAMLSLTIYVAMAISAAVGLIWRIKLAELFAAACAPIGAAYTALALITGSIWGKPTWGAWWAWDARLTSELLLFFLYCGVIALRSAIPDARQAGRAAAVLAIVGVINVPIVHFSVEWWNSLHQGATVTRLDAPTIDASMATPLYLTIIGFWLFWLGVALALCRTELVHRERNKRWVRALYAPAGVA